MNTYFYPNNVIRIILHANTTSLFVENQTTFMDFVHISEGIFIIFTNLSSAIVIYLVISTKIVHYNLRTIIFFFTVIYLPYSLGRIPLILVERRILTFSGNLYSDLPLLIAGFFRGWYLLATMLTIPSILCERLAASYYIDDYEKNTNGFISMVISLSVIVISSILTYLVHCGAISTIVIAAVACLIQCFSVGVFIVIYKINKTVEQQLSTHLKDYTLSRKFQLMENWRVIKLIRYKVICLTILLFILCIWVSFVILVKPAVITGFLNLLLEFAFSGGPMIINVVDVFTFEEWRDVILRKKKKPDKNVDHFTPVEVTQTYFKTIHHMWQ